jgi:hypothetical protein
VVVVVDMGAFPINEAENEAKIRCNKRLARRAYKSGQSTEVLYSILNEKLYG